jgi:hypothetical protein
LGGNGFAPFVMATGKRYPPSSGRKRPPSFEKNSILEKKKKRG